MFSLKEGEIVKNVYQSKKNGWKGRLFDAAMFDISYLHVFGQRNFILGKSQRILKGDVCSNRA